MLLNGPMKTQGNPSKKALILQHAPEDPPGTLLPWFEKQAITPVVFETYLGKVWPKVEDYDLVIALGGVMNVDQEDRFPWLREEKELLRQSIALKKKTLGLCLGGQLIAEVLGSPVHRHDHWEVGWHSVKINNEHPFLRNSAPSVPVFQYHGYRFHLPPLCVRLASNEACSEQGFAFENHVAGFQFHPESTVPWIHYCADSLREEKLQGQFVQKPEELLEQIQLQTQLQSWFHSFLDQFYLA